MLTRKQKRDAKNARHRKNEIRRTKRCVETNYPHVAKLMGVDFMVDVLRFCRRK